MTNYFKRFGTILEAKIIRDKNDSSHKGCAFLKCLYFHEADAILRMHKDEQRSKHRREKRGKKTPKKGRRNKHR